MTMFIVQTAILLAIAFVLGCLLGYLLRVFLGVDAFERPKGKTQPTLADSDQPAISAKLTSASEPKAAPEQQKNPPTRKTTATETSTEKTTTARKAAPKTAAKSTGSAAKKSKAAKAPTKTGTSGTAKAAAKSAAKSSSRAKSTAAQASASGQKDDLKRIRGIGPKLEARMNAIDILTYEQIAGWTAKQQREFGEKLSFPGRIERDGWVKQAKLLAKGKGTEFSKRVDKGQVDSSEGKVAAASLGKKPPMLKKEPAKGPDNLTLIDGVGKALEKKLFALGIYKFSQIAKWTKDQQVWIGNEIGAPGRPERENWVRDAKTLAAGGTTPHAKKVESGAVKSSRKS